MDMDIIKKVLMKKRAEKLGDIDMMEEESVNDSDMNEENEEVGLAPEAEMDGEGMADGKVEMEIEQKGEIDPSILEMMFAKEKDSLGKPGLKGKVAEKMQAMMMKK